MSAHKEINQKKDETCQENSRVGKYDEGGIKLDEKMMNKNWDKGKENEGRRRSKAKVKEDIVGKIIS